MSLTTLEIMNQHRSDQIELSPSSELFTVSGGVDSFYGIFDDSRLEGPKDSGNVMSKKQSPRIMAASIPTGLESGLTVTREDETSYTVFLIEDDTEGLVPIWLY